MTASRTITRPSTEEAALPPSEAAPTPTTQAELQRKQSPDDKFLTFIRKINMAPAYAGYPDIDLILDCDKVCDALRAGTRVADVQKRMPNTTPQDFAWFTDTASHLDNIVQHEKWKLEHQPAPPPALPPTPTQTDLPPTPPHP